MPRKIKNQTACIALRDFSYNDNIESKNLISTRLTCLGHIHLKTMQKKKETILNNRRRLLQ